MKQPLLRVVNISKRFGGVRAVEKVSFDSWPGEVMGLVGDNGAGKSTLIKMISGVYVPEEGDIYWKGERINLTSPRNARELGIETIYQDLSLADNLEATANIFLGKELVKPILGGLLVILDKKTMFQKSKQILDQLGIEVDSVLTPVRDLSGGQRQSVAIARAIYWDAQLMIMDEPTAALGVKERNKVLDLVKALKNRGVSVIFISHNLLDIFAVTDRIVIMKRGIKAGEKITGKVTEDEIIKMMIGSGL